MSSRLDVYGVLGDPRTEAVARILEDDAAVAGQRVTGSRGCIAEAMALAGYSRNLIRVCRLESGLAISLHDERGPHARIDQRRRQLEALDALRAG